MRRHSPVAFVLVCLALLPMEAAAATRLKTRSGTIEGTTTPDAKVQAYLGIPFAAPPVGNLRWKEPQPVKRWQGVRQATQFGARCMQGPVFGDMMFRDAGASEDCLSLNVWTPASKAKAKLPVMVWIYGGGFQAGATSEARQDGQFLARRGVVVVSMNYRLGIFGFFAHPELTRESPHHASGNYGLMDQAAALRWVKDNIAAFGGDPGNITIFGESAGSFSVSAQMASPMAKSLITRAIGESGAMFGRTLAAGTLATAEQEGAKFASEIGADSLEKLRAVPAQELLDKIMKGNPFWFTPIVDGYFLPATMTEIYTKGEQAHVPLLAGWNRDEGSARGFFAKETPTKDNYVNFVRRRYGDSADEILKVFPADTDEQAIQSAGQLASASFTGYGTWKWIELQQQTGGAPVYRFEFDQAPPAAKDAKDTDAGKMAYHSAEIEYVFETLASKDLPFAPNDSKVSELMAAYWTNFAKTGNPNGAGLPEWPQYGEQHTVMHLSPTPRAAADAQRDQYLVLDKLSPPPAR